MAVRSGAAGEQRRWALRVRVGRPLRVLRRSPMTHRGTPCATGLGVVAPGKQPSCSFSHSSLVRYCDSLCPGSRPARRVECRGVHGGASYGVELLLSKAFGVVVHGRSVRITGRRARRQLLLWVLVMRSLRAAHDRRLNRCTIDVAIRMMRGVRVRLRAGVVRCNVRCRRGSSEQDRGERGDCDCGHLPESSF
jgi:hypothetical protein